MSVRRLSQRSVVPVLLVVALLAAQIVSGAPRLPRAAAQEAECTPGTTKRIALHAQAADRLPLPARRRALLRRDGEGGRLRGDRAVGRQRRPDPGLAGGERDHPGGRRDRDPAGRLQRRGGDRREGGGGGDPAGLLRRPDPGRRARGLHRPRPEAGRRGGGQGGGRHGADRQLRDHRRRSRADRLDPDDGRATTSCSTRWSRRATSRSWPTSTRRPGRPSRRRPTPRTR